MLADAWPVPDPSIVKMPAQCPELGCARVRCGPMPLPPLRSPMRHGANNDDSLGRRKRWGVFAVNETLAPANAKVAPVGSEATPVESPSSVNRSE